MKKLILCLSMLLFCYSLCLAKITVINDEFNGTEYYKTEHANLSYVKAGFDTWGQIRFRTANGDKSIIIMDFVISYTPQSVFTLDKAQIKFSNNETIDFIPENKISTDGINFSYTGSGNQFVLCSKILSEKDIENIKSQAVMFRLETGRHFKNIKISKSEATKISNLLNELLKFLGENK